MSQASNSLQCEIDGEKTKSMTGYKTKNNHQDNS